MFTLHKPYDMITSIMKSSQFESEFPKDYRKEDVENILKLVWAGKFCQLISLPGGGKATVLKLLAFNDALKKYHLGDKKNSTLFIYLNLLELPDYSQPTIDKFLLLRLGQEQLPSDPILLSESLKNKIREIGRAKTVIFLFDHFDEFQNQLSFLFFQRLRSLRSISKYKFSCVFASRRDISSLLDEQILKEFYDFFVGNAVYMQLSDKAANDFLLSEVEKTIGVKLKEESKRFLIKISGGHTKILKVSAETLLLEKNMEKPAINYLLQKQLVRASLLELWFFLNPQEQKVLIDISKGKLVEKNESLGNLVLFGLLSDKLEFTIPIFEEFVKNYVSKKEDLKKEIIFNPSTHQIIEGDFILSDQLTSSEYKLLKFLLENKDRIVERDEIINNVWKENQSTAGVTDQAIDQLIFRLRKKVEKDPNNPVHILTIKGRGFKFVP